MRESLWCHVKPQLSEFWCLNKFLLLCCQLRSWRWMEELVTFNLTLYPFHTTKPPLHLPANTNIAPNPSLQTGSEPSLTPLNPPSHTPHIFSQQRIRGLAWSESKFRFGTVGLNHNLHLWNYNSPEMTVMAVLVIVMDTLQTHAYQHAQTHQRTSNRSGQLHLRAEGECNL